MRAKYTSLLDNEELCLWMENIKRGSGTTAEVYLRRMGKFCQDNQIVPNQILTMDSKERDTLLLKYISKLEKEGKAGSYIKSTLKPIRSWLNWNGLSVGKKIKIKNADRTPTLRDETVPDQSELKKILNAATVQQRAAIAIVAFGGCRPEVMGNYYGTDGLVIGDLPELIIKEGEIVFDQIPTMVVIREELSKTGNRYFTFIGPEGCSYLTAYLEYRIKNGEHLTKKSPLITPIRREKSFIRTTNIGDMIRNALRTAGNTNRPYVLRSYFATALMQAESRGLLRDWRTYFMGHKGDIEHVYTLNKNNLPNDLIQKMREAYSASLELFETNYEPRTVRDMWLESYRKMASDVFDVPESETEGKTMDELTKLMRSRSRNMGNDLLRTILTMAGVNPDSEEARTMTQSDLIEKLIVTFSNGNQSTKKQKIITADQLDEFMSNGAEFVSQLRDGRVVIKFKVTGAE